MTGQASPPTRRIARSGQVTVVVDAPADAVWRVVADVTRTGEWSHECQQVTWLGGATQAAPGARFRGRNKSGWVRWHRISEVIRVQPPRELAWRTLSTPLYPDSTEWSLRIEAEGPRTRITQNYRVTRLPVLLDWLFTRIIPAHTDRTAGLNADLHRLGAAAATDTALRMAGRGDTGAEREGLSTRGGDAFGDW